MSEQPKITICLLNYRRPRNIPIILEAIRNQSVRSEIFLWNNGEEDVGSPLIDRYERSPVNAGCMARWEMAKKATTPFVMSLDDDTCFYRKDALENIISELEKQDHPNRIIGFLGACFGSLPYYMGQRQLACRFYDEDRRPVFKPLARDAAVDMVKGRVMAFRRELLDTVALPQEREDDIFLSAAFSKKARRFHRLPASLNDAFYDLPRYDCGNWDQRGHRASRDRAARIYFSRNPLLENRFIFYMLTLHLRLTRSIKDIWADLTRNAE